MSKSSLLGPTLSILAFSASFVPCAAEIERIFDLTLPHTVFDFQELPPGPTDIQAITAAHPRTLLTGITALPASQGATDYDACSNGVSGHALGGNPDGSGELGIFTVGQFFDSSDYIIDLLLPTTQFGFVIQNVRTWPTLEFYLGDEYVGDYFVWHAADCTKFVGVESAQPFDRIVIDAGGSFGYLLDKLYIPDLTPDSVPTLTLSKPAEGPTLHWTTLPHAVSYDVVRGRLLVLQSTGGDFGEATIYCLAEDTTATSIADPAAPPPGRVRFYLVRANTGSGSGTYDSGGETQHADRDAGIADAVNVCF